MGVRVIDVHLTIYVLTGKASYMLQTTISSINMTNKTCLACPSEVTVTIFCKIQTRLFGTKRNCSQPDPRCGRLQPQLE